MRGRPARPDEESDSRRCRSIASSLLTESEIGGSSSNTPTTALEAVLWARGFELVAGVDEVGRGCVAGPVVAAACILPAGIATIEGVRDSKALSPTRRATLAAEIRERALAIGVGAASRREIDRRNIRVATGLAMRRALAQLGTWEYALYDGLPLPELEAERTTAVVRGDATCLSIACASIIAKVTRDGLMARLARRYPDYGWDHNAGYGTAEHLAALERCGSTPHHRVTFAPVRELLARSAGRRP